MKKVSGFIAIVAIGILTLSTFTSCKKDYVCECTYTLGGGSSWTTTDVLANSTKADAEDACDAIQLDNAGAVCTLQ